MVAFHFSWLFPYFPGRPSGIFKSSPPCLGISIGLSDQCFHPLAQTFFQAHTFVLLTHTCKCWLEWLSVGLYCSNKSCLLSERQLQPTSIFLSDIWFGPGFIIFAVSQGISMNILGLVPQRSTAPACWLQTLNPWIRSGVYYLNSFWNLCSYLTFQSLGLHNCSIGITCSP